MLKRKIEDSLTLWKDSTGHKPLEPCVELKVTFYNA